MANTPEPCTEAEHVSEDGLVDVGLKLAGFPSDLLVLLAETLGNPLALLVSKAHLSKAFCKAARDAQGLIIHVDLREWKRTVDDAAVAAVVSKCSQLSSLTLHGCRGITDEAVKAVASGCTQLTSLGLCNCVNLTNVAMVALASGCKQLSSLTLGGCNKITDAAVLLMVAWGCKQLVSLDLADSLPQHH